MHSELEHKIQGLDRLLPGQEDDREDLPVIVVTQEATELEAVDFFYLGVEADTSVCAVCALSSASRTLIAAVAL